MDAARKRIKKKDLRADVLIVVAQTLEKTRNVFHMLITPNSFGQITCARDDARTRRCWEKILKLIPKNIHIREILRKRTITLFDEVEDSQMIEESKLVAFGESVAEIIT